jgi:hypothetical protein
LRPGASDLRGPRPGAPVRPCSGAPGSPGESIPRGPRVLPRRRGGAPRARRGLRGAPPAGPACGACSQSTPGAGGPRAGRPSPLPMAARKRSVAHRRAGDGGYRACGVHHAVANRAAMAMSLCTGVRARAPAGRSRRSLRDAPHARARGFLSGGLPEPHRLCRRRCAIRRVSRTGLFPPHKLRKEDHDADEPRSRGPPSRLPRL